MTCLDVQRFPMQRHSHRQRAGLNSREPRLSTLETSPKLSGRHVYDSLESSAERGVGVVAHRPSYINQLHIPLSAITLRPSAFARLSGIPETEMRGNYQQIGIARDGPVR